LERLRANEARLAHAASLLRASPEELGAAIERRLAQLREVEDQLRVARQGSVGSEASALAATAGAGVVVARRDGLAPNDLRELALAVLGRDGVDAVVLGGCPEEGKVTLVAAVSKAYPVGAPDVVAAAARMVGGGGGGRNHELAMAGGRDASRLDEALALARAHLEGGSLPEGGGSS